MWNMIINLGEILEFTFDLDYLIFSELAPSIVKESEY